jgi:hypothetical protein
MPTPREASSERRKGNPLPHPIARTRRKKHFHKQIESIPAPSGESDSMLGYASTQELPAMLVIRDEQLAALRAQAIRTRILDAILVQLVSLEYLDKQEIDRPAAPGQPTLREQVHLDLLAADAHGVASEDGYLQFASYRFEFGPDWQQRPSVMEAWKTASGREAAFLQATHTALSASGAE